MIEQRLIDALHSEAENIETGDADHKVLRRATRRVVFSLTAMSVLVLGFIAALSWINLDDLSLDQRIAHTPPRPPSSGEGFIEDVPIETRAEIFAFRAVAAVGLMDPYGTHTYNWTYRDDTTETTDGWRIGFAASDCAPRGNVQTCRGLSGEDPELGNALTDTYVSVTLAEGTWQVVGMEGNVRPGDSERIVGYNLPDVSGPSHWEVPVVSTGGFEGGSGYTMLPLWVGPFPTRAPVSTCVAEALDGSGQVVATERFDMEPPDREFERGGGVHGRGFEDVQGEMTDVEVSCEQKEGEGEANGPQRIEASDAPISTGGYVFSDLFFQTDRSFDPSRTERISLHGGIGFEVGFPGTKTCTWEVLDAGGSVIGSATNEFTAQGPSEGMIKDTLVINGEPARIAIDCGGDRLDDPSGHFEFSDVQPIRHDAQRELNRISVQFTFRWVGGAQPSPQSCDIAVYAEDGSLILEGERGFSSKTPGPKRSEFAMGEGQNMKEPATATISCHPID